MLEVLEVAGLATIQDAGRTGFRRFGVPLAGPMDRFAFEAANMLVGNRPDAAALEIGAGDMLLQAQQDCLVAVTGIGYDLSIGPWQLGLWSSCLVRGGSPIHLAHSGFGMWAYFAIYGGFDCPRLLGSRSTYLRGRFGGLEGRALQPGDVLPAPSSRRMMEMAACTLPEAARPRYAPSPILDVIRGPQAHRFAPADLSAFFSGEYRITASSDRMGYRLEGPALRSANQPELTSEGMTVGSIQIPADGQPIAMMADGATTGGYPKIGCIAGTSMPLLAQCSPGQDVVRFRETTVEAAQSAYRAMMTELRDAITHDADGYSAV